MNLKLIMVMLGLSMSVVALATHIYTPLLPQVQQILDTSYLMIYLTVSIFMIMLAVMQLVFGPIVDRRGRRTVLLPCLLLYAIASFGCALSSSIYLLLFFRFLQGIGAAAIPVVAITLIGDLFEGQERAKAMSIYQMILMLAPGVGPLIGGFIGAKTGHFGVFMFLGILASVLLVINMKIIPETKANVSIERSFALRDYLTILKNRIGQASIFLGFTTAFTLYTILVFLPEMLVNNFQFKTDQVGVVFVPLLLMTMLGNYLGARLQIRVGSETSILISVAMTALIILPLSLALHSSFWLFIVVLMGIGIMSGMSMPAPAVILAKEFSKERATANGVFNFIRYLGMGLGPAVGGLLYKGGTILPLLSVVFILLVLSLVVAWPVLRRQGDVSVES